MENVELIPTALSYEFLPDKQTPKATSPKPSVRINFGQAYSFKVCLLINSNYIELYFYSY